MNPILGWALAAALVAMSWQAYRWSGVALAVTVIAFWLLLQFNRTIRAMKNASSSPVGHVDSAVMFNAKLNAGMTMLQVIALTKSLGRSVAQETEIWRWQDEGGSAVTLTMRGGRLEHWVLTRPEAESTDA